MPRTDEQGAKLEADAIMQLTAILSHAIVFRQDIRTPLKRFMLGVITMTGDGYAAVTGIKDAFQCAGTVWLELPSPSRINLRQLNQALVAVEPIADAR